jgi:hypothetical protein
MFELQKSDCSGSINHGINLTVPWRDKMSVRYSDPRNAKASACLTILAAEAAGLSDSDWLRLQPYFDGGAPWREAISKTARAVGFRHNIKDLHTFVEHLLDVLAEQPVSA